MAIVFGSRGRVERILYELCVLIGLRDALRRREVYVQGAGRWKNPDEDLPGDFEDNRDVHYTELGKTLDAAEFVAGLRKRLDDGLTRLDTALARGTSGGVRNITRQSSPWVSVPKLEKLPEPRNVRATYVTRENLRAAVTTVVNATLEARPAVVGRGDQHRVGVGCASTPSSSPARPPRSPR